MDGIFVSLLIFFLLAFAAAVLLRALFCIPPNVKISIVISGDSDDSELEKAAIIFRTRFPGATVHIARGEKGQRLMECLTAAGGAAKKDEG